MTVRDLLDHCAALDVDPDDVLEAGGAFLQAPPSPSVASRVSPGGGAIVDVQVRAWAVVAGWSEDLAAEQRRAEAIMRPLYERLGVPDGNGNRRGSILRALGVLGPDGFLLAQDSRVSDVLVYLALRGAETVWNR